MGNSKPARCGTEPISDPGDGTQIWRITHNGVDTHPIHFHLFDVQVINRVDFAGLVKPPDPNELGWKETVRMNPGEDVIVALRRTAPQLPFGLPESVRLYDVTMPAGTTGQFANVDPNGVPGIVYNNLTNFGIEDPRTSKRIDFVGGIRGLSELERRVDTGEMAAAFALFPTSIEELLAIADAGKIMPPKSTWFEPKLRDGMVVHFLT